MSLSEGIAQFADHQDVGMAPDDALIGVLKDLDPVPTAILGRFAGNFGGRQGMRQRILRAADRGHTEASGNLERALAGARHDGGGALRE